MKLFNRKQLALAIATAATFGAGGANALPSSATHTHVDPVGIGDCQLLTDNWLPPLGMNPGSIPGWIGHPCPQPRPNHGGFFGSQQTTVGDTTTVITPEGQHAAVSPFDNPPGSNFLRTVNHNLIDFNGDEMPNTQPSALGSSDYMLHKGPVRTKRINPINPAQDMDRIIDKLELSATKNGRIKGKDIDFLIDILEGNKIKGKKRAYSGFPMLHYNGPNKLGKVKPIFKNGVKVGGNLNINMIYFDQHIESDTGFIDVSDVQDVPWTITYRINILNGGIEDFSPMTMHFDRTPADTRGPFHASMDQSYFPMLEEGTRYKIKIKETLGKYYNLTYTWGWRIHPPRVQVTENALKTASDGEEVLTLIDHERKVFGDDPMGSEANKLAAIAKIGDISPAKRMWNILRDLRARSHNGHHYHGHGHHGYYGYHKKHKKRTKNFRINPAELATIAANLREAYLDWSDRTKLPTGVTADPNATITLLYANNTIYGSKQGTTGTGDSGNDSGQGAGAFKGICNGCAHDWNIRPYDYKVTLLNGDNFIHGYMNVDFGGTRGWENQFQDTDPTTALSEELHTDPTVIEGRRFTVNDDVLLDNTSNPVKQALRDVPPSVNGGAGVSIIKGATVEDNITTVVTNDRVFPINSGGTEEFLEPTPRKLKNNGKIDNNAAQQFGSGCFFTFGRNHAWPNAGGPWGGIFVPPANATTGEPGLHKVNIEYNFEPSRRLKIYQFDPLHHDIAVYSLH